MSTSTQFTLSPLPYALDALSPVLSEEALEYHYGRHHQGYVTNLNRLLEGDAAVDQAFQNLTLEQIIVKSQTSQNAPIFNNAAQVWNHSFYWNCLSPRSNTTEIQSELRNEIEKNFGSLEQFKIEFNKIAIGTFGSGWAWLVKTNDPTACLKIISTSNAKTPIAQPQQGFVPLLTCDVWEHAYYIDYRNARPSYLEKFWELVNWQWVSQCFLQPH